MSQYPPPPGAPPPPADPEQPSYGQPQYGPPGPAPGYFGPPVHQPGVVPLRPLTLGDLFGGALQTIRRNPKATVGVSALVSLGFMLIPIVGTLALGAWGDLSDPFDFSSTSSSASTSTDFLPTVSSLIGSVFGFLAGIVITGLIMRVVEGAVVGRKVSAAEAWSSSRGRLLRLLGLSLLQLVVALLVIGIPVGVGIGVGLAVSSTVTSVLLGILGGLVGVVASVFLYVRFGLLSAPNLVLEGNGVLRSLSRAGELSRGQFWRLLGISVLAQLASGVVGQIFAIPFVVIGFVGAFLLPSSWAAVSVLLASYVATVLTGAVLTPFTSGVTALQYYDQRFRKEGHDIELLNQALAQGPS